MRTAEGRWFEAIVYEMILDLSLQTDLILSVVARGGRRAREGTACAARSERALLLEHRGYQGPGGKRPGSRRSRSRARRPYRSADVRRDHHVSCRLERVRGGDPLQKTALRLSLRAADRAVPPHLFGRYLPDGRRPPPPQGTRQRPPHHPDLRGSERPYPAAGPEAKSYPPDKTRKADIHQGHPAPPAVRL